MTDFFDDPLWHRISGFSLDDPDARFPLSHRLARESGWSLHFAERVIGEYKRFCYLAMRAGHPVSPSEEVDQAWHMHLLYTRSYWEEFCSHVLESPFHHGPTKGGGSEKTKFRDWYQNILDSYSRVFGEPPPNDIWPPVNERFRHVAAWRRVNIATHWVIRKPKWLS